MPRPSVGVVSLLSPSAVVVPAPERILLGLTRCVRRHAVARDAAEAPKLLSKSHGAWRSLVSALVWGTRGPEFESRRPDQENPAQGGVFLLRSIAGFRG